MVRSSSVVDSGVATTTSAADETPRSPSPTDWWDGVDVRYQSLEEWTDILCGDVPHVAGVARDLSALLALGWTARKNSINGDAFCWHRGDSFAIAVAAAEQESLPPVPSAHAPAWFPVDGTIDEQMTAALTELNVPTLTDSIIPLVRFFKAWTGRSMALIPHRVAHLAQFLRSAEAIGVTVADGHVSVPLAATVGAAQQAAWEWFVDKFKTSDTSKRCVVDMLVRWEMKNAGWDNPHPEHHLMTDEWVNAPVVGTNWEFVIEWGSRSIQKGAEPAAEAWLVWAKRRLDVSANLASSPTRTLPRVLVSCVSGP